MRKNKSCGVEKIYSKGFTLIELLAVIVILAIIALIATPIVLDIIDSAKKSSVEATMKNIEKAALLEYSDLVLDGKEKEKIIYNCYDGKCIYNGKTLNVKGDMPDRGRIIVNEAGTTFENIIIKGYNCIKENNKFTCNNTGLTKVNGTSILIDNNKTTEIENYRIYGNSIQNGTPTPDTPVEVESVGDLITQDNCSSYGLDACSNVGKYVIPIKVTGKNLFNLSSLKWKFANTGNIKYEFNNNSVILERLTPNNTAAIFTNIALNPGTYTISVSNISYESNGIDISQKFMYSEIFGTIYKEKTFSLSDSKSFDMYFYIPESSNQVGDKITYSINIEYGDKATEYEPYKETITNIYLDEPLRSIGKYSDYIDFKTKKVVRNIKQINLSDLSWSKNGNAFFSSHIDDVADEINSTKIKSDKFTVQAKTTDNSIYINHKKVYIWNSNYSDISEFKTIINNSKLYYQLNASIEEDINLPKLSINKDTSVISVGASIKPGNIELEYYR